MRSILDALLFQGAPQGLKSHQGDFNQLLSWAPSSLSANSAERTQKELKAHPGLEPSKPRINQPIARLPPSQRSDQTPLGQDDLLNSLLGCEYKNPIAVQPG